MKMLLGAALAALLVPAGAFAQDTTALLSTHLYAGTSAEGLEAAAESCGAGATDGCFAEGLFRLVLSYEGLAQDFYRYGATVPTNPAAAMMLGMDAMGEDGAPANPNPEQLTYDGFRSVLEDFVADLDETRAAFEKAGESGDYVITLDPLLVRIDFDGNGKVDEGETLGALLRSFGEFTDIPMPDEVPEGGKTKTAPTADTTIGFDRADAVWFSGYMQITATPPDLLLAHDFSPLFNAFFHRIFPKSGLPMQDYSVGGTLMLDPESDTAIADLIAMIHTMNFPVVEPDRLAGVLDRLKSITALSRQNWELILAETDDNRELVPAPKQTSLVEGRTVSQEIVDAWLETLDTIDQVLAGELLVPHWRFKQGVDLPAYFQTATNTDLVMLFTGHAAVPLLRDGPIVDAEKFAKANEVFGDDWFFFALWFN